MPYAWVTVGGSLDSGRDVPLHVADISEAIEQEPNNERTHATPLGLAVMMNGRFDSEGDNDWFRLDLSSLQPIWLETFAHRHMKAPVDTLVQIYDFEGKLLQESDEGVAEAGYEQWYDFRTPDTRLTFTPKTPGVYFVKVTDANRAFGLRAVYRLQCKSAEPDFVMIQFPGRRARSGGREVLHRFC